MVKTLGINKRTGPNHRELEQMEPILNFQVPAEGLELGDFTQG